MGFKNFRKSNPFLDKCRLWRHKNSNFVYASENTFPGQL